MTSQRSPSPICPELIRSVLDYDPDSGILRWKTRPSNRVRIGDVAGTKHGNGYICIRVAGKGIFAHRAAWAHFYGENPPIEIDHRDGDFANNAIKNLRDASHKQNMRNAHGWQRATSEFKGVSYSSDGKRRKRWLAQIKVDGRYKYLGRFMSEGEASRAYEVAAKESFGNFARGGKCRHI